MNLAVCLLCIFLVPLATAGLALIHQGLGRSRSAAHAMLATLCALGITAIVFVLIGFSWAGYTGGLAHTVHLAARQWNLLGAEPFFATELHTSLLRGSMHPRSPNSLPGPYLALVLAFEIFAAGIASLIPISSGGDRWRLAAICASSALLAALFFPLFTHWVWGAGWLAELPTLFRLPPFTDIGGAGVIHVIGGLTALSVAWIVGPRHGKYTNRVAAAIPGHNVVQVLFGCILALIGWIGLDASASMLFYNASAVQVALVAINAVLSAAGGSLAAALITRLRYSRPDASISANGWIAGLVAGSAACGLVSPVAAIFIGLVAGTLVSFLIEALELKLLLDDPGGAISVHLGAGLWGLLAFGIFGPTTGSRLACLVSQLAGIATLLGLMLPLIHVGHLLLNKVVRFRVDTGGDWHGMDIYELGAGAYPEFVIHADEFVPR